MSLQKSALNYHFIILIGFIVLAFVGSLVYRDTNLGVYLMAFWGVLFLFYLASYVVLRLGIGFSEIGNEAPWRLWESQSDVANVCSSIASIEQSNVRNNIQSPIDYNLADCLTPTPLIFVHDPDWPFQPTDRFTIPTRNNSGRKIVLNCLIRQLSTLTGYQISSLQGSESEADLFLVRIDEKRPNELRFIAVVILEQSPVTVSVKWKGRLLNNIRRGTYVDDKHKRRNFFGSQPKLIHSWRDVMLTPVLLLLLLLLLSIPILNIFVAFWFLKEKDGLWDQTKKMFGLVMTESLAPKYGWTGAWAYLHKMNSWLDPNKICPGFTEMETTYGLEIANAIIQARDAASHMLESQHNFQAIENPLTKNKPSRRERLDF